MTTTKLSTFIAATIPAIAMSGLLAGAAPSWATPMVPLAPACSQYNWPGGVVIREPDTGWSVSFNSNGPIASGEAIATNVDGTSKLGVATGSITGTKVTLTINYRNGQRQTYDGQVFDNGMAAGETLNGIQRESFIKWQTAAPLVCADVPPVQSGPVVTTDTGTQPDPGPAPQPKNQLATVTSDVDYYDSPGFDGNVLGILRAGEKYALGSCSDGSCEVKGKGWAAEEFFQKP